MGDVVLCLVVLGLMAVAFFAGHWVGKTTRDW